MVISIDLKKNVELSPPPNKDKEYYTGGTNDKTRGSQKREYEDSRSDTSFFGRKIDEEHKN